MPKYIISLEKFDEQLDREIGLEELIMCKDCKYAYMTYGGECKYCDCWEEEGEMYLDGDFYCAFGKRREDSNTHNTDSTC